ncbi:glycoside hydrolase family 88 protein [Ginsengibacter hankyongi]|uniref:glycoside hydrolase family 88 protein n=1 Tax=Ginsengibacter hankyongi TaxID=2607284 RepID=UPI001928BC3C|nr:glycoside hydrolase family 88 protein [Ginsengibacter hankyongi]
MKKYLLTFLLIAFVTTIFHKTSIAQSNFRADSTLKIMEKVADWQLETWQKEGMRHPIYDWTNGAAYAGFMALNEIANDSKYSKAMYNIGEAIDWNPGPRRAMADDYCVGQMFSQMYSLYREPKMIAQFRGLADTIVAFPHTESLEWKNNVHLREWAWCDALFMGPPALAYLSTATGNTQYLDIASKLWWKTTDYLFDSSESLYFRDSRYFDKKEPNGRKMFWSRGNGWVMGGLVRMLENMPADYPDRPRFISLYKRMAQQIASLQSDDGSWHASLLDAASYPVKETSGTGFYCYALAYGVNHGLLPGKEFDPVIEKAWAALVSSVHSDGKLGNVQPIGAQPDSVDSNSTEVYGTGAFLLAGSEMIDLLLRQSQNSAILSLHNKTGLHRKEEVIAVPYNEFISKTKSDKNKKFKIFNSLTGEEIPFQLEYRGNKIPVNVLIQVSLSPGSKLYAETAAEDPSEFKIKTYARFVPERYDDFAWENDRIAFRVYGAALEKTNENAYGQDVWAKRTPALIINKWYKTADYHVDHGEGLDFYEVGFSLGAGSSAPYVKDSIYYSKNFRKYKILDNGPLRSTFQLDYNDWNVDGKIVDEYKIISLDAGSQLNKIETVYSFKDKRELPVAIGIVEHAGNGTMLLNERDGIMGYWEPQHGKDGSLGIGSVILEPVLQMNVSHHHLLTIIKTESKKPLVYYTGATWDKAGMITSSKEWFEYLENFKTELERPVLIDWL